MTLVIPDVLEATCATRQALERLASKWRVLVVYALLAGPQRHAELRRRLPGVSQKVLTQTLRAMEDDGLVARRVLVMTRPASQDPCVRRHCRLGHCQPGRRAGPACRPCRTR
jgi:DNA-binding HxlR family transcriptional regulator